MSTLFFGKLLTNVGKDNYKEPESVENVIRYITRTNKNPKDDLICWGGFGILEYAGVKSAISQFELAQQLNERNNSRSRFIDHEYFSFTKEGENLLAEGNVDLNELAREMAYDIYSKDQCQVIYAVHGPDAHDDHLNIHFAVNTYDLTGHKRRENKSQTRERETRFNNMIAAKVKEGLLQKDSSSQSAGWE